MPFSAKEKRSDKLKNKETCNIAAPPKKRDIKSKLIWTLIFVVLAVMSVFAVTNMSKDFTVEKFLAYIADTDPLLICVAVIAMLGFIFFEALAVLAVVKGFGYRQKFIHGLIYSASDIYVSAITPSATGGQPASAYFMCRDGIPTGVVTVSLMVNLVMYTISIVVIGLCSIIFNPGIFLKFDAFSQTLIVLGTLIQGLIVAALVLLLRHEKVLKKICNGVLSFLSKIKLLKNRKKYEEKLEKTIEDYKHCAEMIRGRKAMIVKCFIFNVLQRVSTILVPVFVFLAAGGEIAKARSVFAVQNLVVLGSNCIPLPGAIGVADYLMLDGFGALGIENHSSMELFSRALSFYVCVLLCFAATAIAFVVKKQHRKKRTEVEK